MPMQIFGHVSIASDEARFALLTLDGGMNALGIEDVRRWLRHWQDPSLAPGRRDSTSL